MRISHATALTALATIFAAGAASAQELDRAGIIGVADAYLAALVARDPGAAPLAADVKFVENVTRLEPGQGFWATATGGPTDFKIYVPDVALQQIGFVGMMEREHPPLPENPTEAQTASAADGRQKVMVAIRLKLENGEIVEAEHLVQPATGEANLARLQIEAVGVTGIPHMAPTGWE